MMNIQMNVIEKGDKSPFIVADLPSESDVRSISSRSFLLKCVLLFVL